jgi:NifU-like protein involved in Fe-S cluster formation
MKNNFDVQDIEGKSWTYSKEVEDHFFHPRNVMTDDFRQKDFDAQGEVGSPACGDVMKIWIKVKKGKISDLKWRTFGCASAIAATSVLTEMAIGMTLDQAYKITAQDIAKNLGGLPRRKIHCSILGDQALRAAIDNWRSPQNPVTMRV